MGSRLRQARAIVAGMALAGHSALADEPAPTPIPVVAQVPSKTYYVGQAIELRVGAEAAGERPEIDTPRIPDTDVSLIGNELSPVNVTGIGSLTSERNLFVTRFRLITRRAGVLRIPPIQARLGTRAGASRPLQVEVQSLPLVGRPAEFLGGVGAFAVDAEASASTVRVGQDLIYTIQVTGPAARGMRNAPALSRFSRLPLGLQVEPLPAALVNSPPSRRFGYRIRPTRAGAASLPPVSVAAFDPLTARYVTRVTSSVAIRVVDVPKFDPSSVAYLRPSVQVSPRLHLTSRISTAAGLIVGIAAFVFVTFAARTIRKRWGIDPGIWLNRRVRELDPRKGSERAAHEIAETLAEYLERRIGRPRGVLTPEEARSAIATATQDPDLRARCARLVSDCDRVIYSGRETDIGCAELVDEARRVLKEIGRKGRT